MLGRGPRLEADRLEVAAALWRIKRAPRIFVSGRGDAVRMFMELQKKGVPEQALGGEECSMTTGENAKFTATVLKPQGIQKILLVTIPPPCCDRSLPSKAQVLMSLPLPAPYPPN
ncbi:MAG: YdcF family protein [Leptolyngbyaceae cyanobacterium HOT.MB2.61]|nr:YdcF family protein [Leptolyngbyaceae cyanobacterium HOT.MB2.61]